MTADFDGDCYREHLERLLGLHGSEKVRAKELGDMKKVAYLQAVLKGLEMAYQAYLIYCREESDLASPSANQSELIKKIKAQQSTGA